MGSDDEGAGEAIAEVPALRPKPFPQDQMDAAMIDLF